jgi:hypothetical protein
LSDYETQAQIAALAHRHKKDRTLSKRQIEALIKKTATVTQNTNAGSTPLSLASGTASESGSLDIEGVSKAYLIVTCSCPTDFEKMTLKINDGCEVNLIDMGATANDSDGNNLIVTHLVRLTNGPVLYDVDVTGGTPNWDISLIWTE